MKMKSNLPAEIMLPIYSDTIYYIFKPFWGRTVVPVAIFKEYDLSKGGYYPWTDLA